MKKVLMSFNGFRDPFSEWNGKKSDGPILNFLKNKSDFDRFILFYNQDLKHAALDTVKIIKNNFKSIDVQDVLLDIPDPSRYDVILTSLRDACSKYCPAVDDTATYEYFVSISSGTPQMHACWLLLTASGEINAKIIHIREKSKVKPGQPLFTEVNPRTRYFPEVKKKIIMAELPAINSEKIDAALSMVGIVGKDNKLLSAVEKASNAARYDVPVLITGESGTGKELIAQFIGLTSGRPKDRYCPLNCSALTATLLESQLFGYKKGAFTNAYNDTRGLFDQADGGILFLDEIGDMPLEMQVKMLRVLENKTFTPVGDSKERKVDVRIVAATNKDLKKAIEQGLFREDLYFRLKVIDIHLPPLRHRKADIPAIANAILEKNNADLGTHKQLTEKAIQALAAYEWPGNIRELKNKIQNLIVLTPGDQIDQVDLPAKISPQVQSMIPLPDLEENFNLHNFLKAVRSALYEKALKQAGNHQSEAARLLGVSAESVSQYLKKSKQ